MNGIVSDLLSWHWWVSVVIVGVAVNLLSAYLKPTLDVWLAKRSEASRNRREKVAREFREEVDTLSSDPTLLVLAGQRLVGGQVALLSLLLIISFVLALGVDHGWSAMFQWLSVVTMILLLIVLMFLMRRLEELANKVASARKLYQSRVIQKRSSGSQGTLDGSDRALPAGND